MITKKYNSIWAKHCTHLLLSMLLLIFTGCSSQLEPFTIGEEARPLPTIAEQTVTAIELKGPLSRRKAQLSGLAIYGDYVVLLPQYPDRYENQLFYLKKQDIVDYLANDTHEPLRPTPISLIATDVITRVEGYQGFESIAFAGERAFLTIEAETDTQMMGYLVTGVISPDLSALKLESNLMTNIAPQSIVDNLADEALVIAGDQVVTVYEVNASFVNLSPVAHVFKRDNLQPLGTIPFPTVYYRITDATSLDQFNRFWAINTFTPDNRTLKFGVDPLAIQYGTGPTHRTRAEVERLVEFQYSSTGITLVDTPPIQLQLLEGYARNWEGITRFESANFNGFLLVTDRRPATILAFLPYPLNLP